MSPALVVYRLVLRLLEPLAPRLLDARAKQGKEDPIRVDERLGRASLPRPDGDLVWLHGVSVGETLSLLPVVERLRQQRPDLTVLVTSGTLTSAQLLAQRLPDGVTHQFAPVDAPGAVTAFLDHWRPSLAVFVESELWPNLILETRRRGVRLVLASARITEKTVEGWQRFPGAAREILSAFDRILPQDETSAARLHSLGARIDGHVNLKLSGEAPPHDAAAFTRLSAAIGDRPVVVAASTHDGEEIALVRALDKLADRLCLVLVPRHPARSADIAAALERDGYRFAQRSQGREPDRDSFSAALEKPPVGGHNPLEPARLGKPAVTGPDMSNWAAVTDALVEAGGLAVVQAPWDLPAVLAPLLADTDAARAMGERGRRAAAEAGSGLDRLWEALDPLLPPAPRGGRR
jgi:3-deoxy-D-manno-octulosonic-acid transferase